MSNYYTQFSLEITNLTEDEYTWLKEKLEEKEDDLACEVTLQRYTLDLYSTEYFNDEEILDFLQDFLKEKRPDSYILFEYANTADRPFTDAYSGGSIFVSAYTQEWSSTHDWEESCRATLGNQIGSVPKMAN